MSDALDALISRFQSPGSAPSGDALDALISSVKPAPQKEEVGVIYDAGKAAGAGIVKGVMGLTALPGTVEQLGRMGINYATGGETVSPQTALPTYDDIKGGYEARAGKLYEPRTTVGKYAGTIAEFAPGMLFPGGAAATAAGRLGMRALQNVVAPGIVSEAAGQLTEGTKIEPVARVVGGVVGGMAPNAVGRMISPQRIDPERARFANTLANEGVDLTAGQVSGSKPLKYAESVAVDTPFAGGRAGRVMENQSEQFTQAALRRAGIDAPRATPEVVDEAFRRIGSEFDAVSSNIQVPLRRISANNTAQNSAVVRQVDQIANEYARISQPSLSSPMPRAIADDLAELADNARNMDGRTYLRWRSELGAAARGTNDAVTRDALYRIQDALDRAAESWLRRSPGQGRDLSEYADRLRQARTQYRNMLVIERAATGAGENAAMGLLSPASLRNATIQQGRRTYARGGGDFGELARAGTALMSPLPNSGTGPRVGTQLLGSAIGSGVGALFGGPGGAVVGSIAPIAGQALMGRTVMNPMMQAYLQNQMAAGLRDLPTAAARTRRAAVIPGTIVQAED
jgi:hypothetical protein